MPVSLAQVKLGVSDEGRGLVDVGGLVEVLGLLPLLSVLLPEAPVTHRPVQRHPHTLLAHPAIKIKY